MTSSYLKSSEIGCSYSTFEGQASILEIGREYSVTLVLTPVQEGRFAHLARIRVLD